MSIRIDEKDRFSFPRGITRVTSGHGGEALFIEGESKNILLDCGMAYCGEETVKKIKKLGKGPDYILLTHSHYDHIGALPYIIDAFPEVKVLASAKCKEILQKESARKLMFKLGTDAQRLYGNGENKPVRVDKLRVDITIEEGDRIEIGTGEYIDVYETRGHTDCSLSFHLMPHNLLFTSESTGILEGEDYVHTPSLKSFRDSLKALKKCKSIKPKRICLPHFGMLPEGSENVYFEMFEKECYNKIDFVSKLREKNLTEEEMLEEYIKRYWYPEKLKEQPFEAFEINSLHVLRALIKETDNV